MGELNTYYILSGITFKVYIYITYNIRKQQKEEKKNDNQSCKSLLLVGIQNRLPLLQGFGDFLIE